MHFLNLMVRLDELSNLATAKYSKLLGKVQVSFFLA